MDGYEYGRLIFNIQAQISSSDEVELFSPRGLDDPKNLCFRNVVIQSLLSATPLKRYIKIIILKFMLKYFSLVNYFLLDCCLN